MIIDSHVHLYPNSLAPVAMSKVYLHKNHVHSTSATIEDTLVYMDQNNIDKIFVLNIANKPNREKTVNKFALSLLNERVFSFGSVNPKSTNWDTELIKLKEKNISGIKFHPQFQDFAVDDKEFYPLYEMLGELAIPVVFHAGWDVGFPESDLAHPKRLRKIIDKFDNLNILCAHFGGLMKKDKAFDYIAGSRAYVDTALVHYYYSYENIMAYIEKHGTDRILYGSDMPWMPSREQIDFFKNLPLGAEDKNKIFYKNALKFISSDK